MYHLAINFHYVGMPKFPFPGIHGVSADELYNTLLLLKERFKFVSQNEIIERIKKQIFLSDLEKEECIITFDDGLRCQFEAALPVLKSLNIPAIFFINCKPYMFGSALLVHKMHWIRANLGESELRSALESSRRHFNMPYSLDSVTFDVAQKIYQYDPPTTAQLKYFFNFVLPESYVETIAESLLSQLKIKESEFIELYYMSIKMIQELAAQGMLGSHAVSHRPLETMQVSEYREELMRSKLYLEKITKRAVYSISYPLGSCNIAIAEEAKRIGYQLGYTMKRGINTAKNQRLLLTRIDSADIKELSRWLPRKRTTQDHTSLEVSLQEL